MIATELIAMVLGSILKTCFMSIRELSVHIHKCLGFVHVSVWVVPENSCCIAEHIGSLFKG
jgi:hypothetical protein